MAVELEVQEEGGEPQPHGEEEEEGQPSQTYLYYLGMVVVVIGFASCIMQLQFHGTSTTHPCTCVGVAPKLCISPQQMRTAQWASVMGHGLKENGTHITVSCTTLTLGMVLLSSLQTKHK